MKKLILPLIAAAALLIGIPGTSIARNGHGHYKHNHGRYYKHGNYYNRGRYYRPYAYYPRPYVRYYAPAPPVYYAPPPVYYVPPPYYAPYYPPVTGQFNFGIVID